MEKILAVYKNFPQSATLEDGVYLGVWEGYTIKLTYKDEHYLLTTESGLKWGLNFRVMVTIDKGEMSFVEIKN